MTESRVSILYDAFTEFELMYIRYTYVCILYIRGYVMLMVKQTVIHIMFVYEIRKKRISK